MPEKITYEELQRRLADPDVPDAEIAPYLRVDPAESRPFDPRVVPDPERLAVEEGLEASVGLAALNGVSRWRRQRRYRKRISRGWSGKRAVSEGDSWFQFPFLLEDVINQLTDDCAILSFGAAGDTLNNMVEHEEVSAAIAAEEADLFLISGGGNDMLGDGALRSYLLPFSRDREPADYLGPRFPPLLERLLILYRRLFEDLLGRFPRLRIVCHTYAYTIPDGGRWLGRPLEHPDLQITDPDLQRAILRQVVDRYYGELRALAEDFQGRVACVDCRDAVSERQWHDELHPNNAGFRAVADRFRAAIDSILS